MHYLLFMYSILLVLSFGACGFGYLALYQRKKDKRDLWISIMFFLFTCDNLIFFMTEFLPEFLEIYEQVLLTVPFLNNIIIIGMIISYRMVLAYGLDCRPGRTEIIIQSIVLLILLFATVASGQKWGRLIFILLNQCVVAGIIIQGFIALHRKRGSMPDRAYKIWRFILIFSGATHFIGAAERVFEIAGAPLTKSYRIIGFELFGLFCVGVAIWYLFRSLSRPEKRISDEEMLDAFVRAYGLTPREAELIPMLLEGAQNSEICEKKFIALNTVKVHTHNIYQKLGIERRSQLSVKVAEFKKGRGRG